MFEKCFVAEQKKLEELPDEALFARFGYSSELHRMFNEMSVQYRALDESLLARLEEKSRVEWARAKERQSKNPLYQKYKTLYDDYLKSECCEDEWNDKFTAYYDAEKACEVDSECQVYVFNYPEIAALTEANPETRLWNAFDSDINSLMRGRDWSLIFGAGHEPDKYFKDNFSYHLFEASRELYPDDEIAFSELSPSEAVRTSRSIYFTWLDHWINEFDEKYRSVFDQFGGIARETCNTRGLYE